MTDMQQDVARRCLAGAEEDNMTFPQIVGALIAAGFEGYAVDLRSGIAQYYPQEGEPITLPIHRGPAPIAPRFDSAAVCAAIGEAQALARGYTYRGFCEKVRAAGCAGYMVSFSGRRALYYGRTAETHVELFQDTN